MNLLATVDEHFADSEQEDLAALALRAAIVRDDLESIPYVAGEEW